MSDKKSAIIERDRTVTDKSISVENNYVLLPFPTLEGPTYTWVANSGLDEYNKDVTETLNKLGDIVAYNVVRHYLRNEENARKEIGNGFDIDAYYEQASMHGKNASQWFKENFYGTIANPDIMGVAEKNYFESVPDYDYAQELLFGPDGRIQNFQLPGMDVNLGKYVGILLLAGSVVLLMSGCGGSGNGVGGDAVKNIPAPPADYCSALKTALPTGVVMTYDTWDAKANKWVDHETKDACKVPKIAFVNAQSEIMTINETGSYSQKLLSDKLEWYAWNDDENIIASLLNGNQYDLYMINVKTGAQTLLKSTPENEIKVMVSPDGTKLLYQADTGTGGYRTYVANIDMSNPVRVGPDTDNAWADFVGNNGVVVSALNVNNYDLYTDSTTGGNIKQLTNTPENEIKISSRK